MHWSLVVYNVAYYTIYPILFLLSCIMYILYWLGTPFIYLGRGIGQIALLPWHFLVQFEAIWYFLGSAIALGVVLGLALHFMMRAFVVVFDLNRKPLPRDLPPKGHDAISYRAAREAKKQKELEKQLRLATEARLIASQPLIQEVVREARQKPMMSKSPGPLSPTSVTSRGILLQETILEHTDEEDDDSVF